MAPRRPISVYYAPLVYRTFPVNQAVDEVRPFRRRDPEIAAAGRKGPLLGRRPDLSLRPPCQQSGRVVRIYNYSNNTVLTYRMLRVQILASCITCVAVIQWSVLINSVVRLRFC